MGELSASSRRPGGEGAEEQAGPEQSTTVLWLSGMGYAGAAMVASGRAKCALGELVAGQRGRTVRVVGRTALASMAVATEWLVVARGQATAGVAGGELVIMAGSAAGIDRGGHERREPAVERTEFGVGGDPLDRSGLDYDGS